MKTTGNKIYKFHRCVEHKGQIKVMITLRYYDVRVKSRKKGLYNIISCLERCLSVVYCPWALLPMNESTIPHHSFTVLEVWQLHTTRSSNVQYSSSKLVSGEQRRQAVDPLNKCPRHVAASGCRIADTWPRIPHGSLPPSIIQQPADRLRKRKNSRCAPPRLRPAHEYLRTYPEARLRSKRQTFDPANRRLPHLLLLLLLPLAVTQRRADSATSSSSSSVLVLRAQVKVSSAARSLSVVRKVNRVVRVGKKSPLCKRAVLDLSNAFVLVFHDVIFCLWKCRG